MAAPESLDTNVILRFLTRDNREQAERALRPFQQVEAGAAPVVTTEAVIVEAVSVLASKSLYNLPRPEIRTHLSTIITLRGLKLPNKRVYLHALDLYASTDLDFVHALIVAQMRRAKIGAIVSFDRDFDRVQGLTRREP